MLNIYRQARDRMAMPRGAVTAALLVLAGCAASPAASPPAAIQAAPTPVDASMAQPVPTTLVGYLRPDAMDGKLILGAPPTPDSPEGTADRAIYEATRSYAGTARWREAQIDNDLWSGGAVKRFSCAVGKDISERGTPVTMRMIHRIELDVRTVGKSTKDFYDRRRPMVGDTRPICVPRAAWMDTNASYPSGHAMTGWAWALSLAEIAPDKASALAVAGREHGFSRVICGVHYASDVEAGQVLGAAMVARLHAEPAYRADLKAARRELARVPAPTGCGG